MSSAHGFIAIPGLPPGPPPQPMPIRRQQRSPTRSLMSPAETTILTETTPACASCGDPGHMYYEKRTKTTLCPKQDQPEVQARANAWLQDFRADKSRSTKAFVSQILAQLQQGKSDINFNKHEHIVLINTIVLASSSNLPHFQSKYIHHYLTSNFSLEQPTLTFNPPFPSS
jgi:hypothetical protein